MWIVKVFKTRAAMTRWVERNGHRYQWHEIFINNAWGVEARKLRIIS